VKVIDGFWLPANLREHVLPPQTEYKTLSFARGRPCEPGDEGAVTVRWPVLGPDGWNRLVNGLRENRQRVPRGLAYWDRFPAALGPVGQRFSDPSDPLHTVALTALPSYTGYSEAMIRMTLNSLDMWAVEDFPEALRLDPRWEATDGWQSMGDLPGRLRFYGARRWSQGLRRLMARRHESLYGPTAPPDLVVGYGAGNVPGTALLISFLAWATALAGGAPPIVLVKNSRREPIFSPLVFRALEAIDPDLVATSALLIWDYEEAEVQERLLSQAGLVLAAASDETIAQVAASLQAVDRSGQARFHAHGHKVNFTAIGREVLARDLTLPGDDTPLLGVVTLLAALDSVFWDQHGCLSSRMHFVESGGGGHYSPLEYATRLAEQLGLLASFLPRGSWPRQQLHDRFDRYKLLEQTGQVQVLSGYDDDFVVVLDGRSVDARSLYVQVNDCMGRVIVVRPVGDLMEVPEKYLGLLPAANLQSLSVAVGRPGEKLTNPFLQFADACGARGVTAIRTIGRGAFPQLAYSWDGLIPLDLVRTRPAGRFTTIEFEAPFDEIVATYRLMLQRGVALGLVGD
jgi:hypothetical protein